MGSSPFARTFSRDWGISSVSFFSPAGVVWRNAQGLAVSYPSVTARHLPGENGNVCRRFGRSHVIKRSRSVPRSLFLRLREEFWKTLRALRPRTPLSLRDISRGRMETSAAVSVARTLSRGRGISQAFFAPSCGVICEKLSGRTWNSTDKLCVLLNLS